MEEAQNSNDPEAKAAADTMTALIEKLETLEGLEEKVKSMDTKDIMARTLLDQEAFEKINTPAVQALMKGNPAVREAARDSALVNARVAQAFHEAYGEPYENIAKIVMGGQVGKNGFNMAASERNKTISHNKNISELRDFPNEINELFKDTPERAKFTSILSGVRYPGERVKHVGGKHGITGSDLEDIDTHIDVLYDPAITAHKNKNGNLYGGQYQGTHIITRVHGDREDYRVVLTFMPNGNVIFESAFKGDAQAIKNDITTHSSKVLQPNGKALPLGSTVIMSIPMIKKELGIVNQTYNQLAGEKALTADRLKLQQAQVMEGGVPLSMENPYFQSGTWGEAAERKLAVEEKRFSKNVDDFVAGKLQGSQSIPVMSTPLVLSLVGARVLPVEISHHDL